MAAVSPSGVTLPADVVAAVKCQLRLLPGQRGPPLAATMDLFLLQWYQFALGPDQQSHPLVPACRYVTLTQTFTLVPVNKLLQPVKLVPNVAASTFSVRDPRTGNSVPDELRPPAFFWLPELL